MRELCQLRCLLNAILLIQTVFGGNTSLQRPGFFQVQFYNCLQLMVCIFSHQTFGNSRIRASCQFLWRLNRSSLHLQRLPVKIQSAFLLSLVVFAFFIQRQGSEDLDLAPGANHFIGLIQTLVKKFLLALNLSHYVLIIARLLAAGLMPLGCAHLILGNWFLCELELVN